MDECSGCAPWNMKIQRYTTIYDACEENAKICQETFSVRGGYIITFGSYATLVIPVGGTGLFSRFSSCHIVFSAVEPTVGIENLSSRHRSSMEQLQVHCLNMFEPKCFEANIEFITRVQSMG